MSYNKLLNSAIIVAGGSGKRMQSEIPKQFLLINNKPVLMHTIEVFFNFNKKIELVLVLPDSQIDYWASLCKKFYFQIPHAIAIGGKERFFSVKNGLEKLKNKSGLVAIHDGVRPLVDNELILRGVVAAQKHRAVVPIIPVTSSVRLIDEENNAHFDRSKLRIVQTPQIFDLKIILKAYNQDYSEFFTDDASVVDALGEKIVLFEGNIQNIKITTKFDLDFVKFLLTNRNEK